MPVPARPIVVALQTDRIALEIPTSTHVAGIFSSFASDPDVTRFLEWPPAESLADCEAAMVGRLARLASGSEISWILVLRATDEVFGSLSLWPRNDGIELGFALSRATWGRGLAVEAARAAVDWARNTFTPRRIWASCDPENQRSGRVLEKLGMREVGTIRCAKVRPNLSPSPRDSRVFELSQDGA